MAFTLLPAVDVAKGRVVQTTTSDPREIARGWQAAGAEWLHLVDMDAAFGRGSNADLLASVVRDLDVNVELSGGIRDQASLERALATGCARVNVSTAALADLAWCTNAIAAYGEQIAMSLDVRATGGSGEVAGYCLAARGSADGGSVEGGTADDSDLWDTIAQLDRAGCARYVVTDVRADGALAGPNLRLYRAVTEATRAAVIASGGVSSIEDLVALAQMGEPGSRLDGAIVGSALYANRFTLPEALAAVRD